VPLPGTPTTMIDFGAVAGFKTYDPTFDQVNFVRFFAFAENQFTFSEMNLQRTIGQ